MDRDREDWEGRIYIGVPVMEWDNPNTWSLWWRIARSVSARQKLVDRWQHGNRVKDIAAGTKKASSLTANLPDALHGG